MSTATAEPSLADAFTSEMAKGGDFALPPDSPLAKTVEQKGEVKPVAETKPAEQNPADTKPADTKPADAVPAKKKSALDAAIADDVVAPAVEPDEAAKLFEQEPTKDNWAKSRENFKKLNEEVKTLRETSKKASEPPAEVLSELKSLKAERDQLKALTDQQRDSIMALDVKYDPSTQAKIQDRETHVAKLAESIKSGGADAQAFLDAMALPLNKRGPSIDAILEAIESPRARAVIERKLAEVEVQDEQIDDMLSKPHATFEQLKQQREIQAKEHAEKVEQYKQATFDNVKKELPKISKLMRLAPEDSEGAKEFNESLLADIERAPKLLDVEPRDAVIQAYKASRYDSVEKIALGLHSKVAELEAELAKFHGSEPGFRGGGKAPAKKDWEVPLEKAFFDAQNNQAPV